MSVGRGAGQDHQGEKLIRLSLVAAAIAAIVTPCLADPVAIHYAPAENLEHIDAALIDSASRQIDMAAYVLTDWPVIEALTRAADRGVQVRIYLDGRQLAEHGRALPSGVQASRPNRWPMTIPRIDLPRARRS
jgi:phosphatidylserine/phosphatidylglycerophosphate/cardiolipin synthase-like enzyme